MNEPFCCCYLEFVKVFASVLVAPMCGWQRSRRVRDSLAPALLSGRRIQQPVASRGETSDLLYSLQ